MWKIVLELLATAVFVLLAHFAYDPSVIKTRVGLSGVHSPLPASAAAPALMYAGVRG